MRAYLIIIATILGLTSCVSQMKRDAVRQDKFFGGEFIYFADAATFVDCVTGARLPVSNAGAYLETERRYSSLGVAPAEAVYVEFIGHLAQEPKMEGEGTNRVVVIDSLLGFDRTVGCDPDGIIAGVYETVSRDGKRILRLKPDYSYTESMFYTSEASQECTGSWFRSARMEVVLMQQTPHSEDSVFMFEVVPPQKALTRNSGGEPLVYTKVYL